MAASTGVSTSLAPPHQHFAAADRHTLRHLGNRSHGVLAASRQQLEYTLQREVAPQSAISYTRPGGSAVLSRPTDDVKRLRTLVDPHSRSSSGLPSDLYMGYSRGFAEQFEVGELLGRGTFGEVHRVTELATGEIFAVKILQKRRSAAKVVCQRERIAAEVDILRLVQGRPEALRLHGAYEDAEQVYIVTELCHGGTLEGYLRNHGALPEDDARKAVRDIMHVLHECHRQNICYADVKPANFLFRSPYPHAEAGDSCQSSPPDISVADFGCSQQVVEGMKLRTRTGTPMYIAPEVFMRWFGVECDMWAAGMLVYQMLAGGLPFWNGTGAGASPSDIMSAILFEDVTYDGDAWKGVSPEAIDFVQKLLDRDYNSRLTSSQALHHPWLVVPEECSAEESEEECLVNNVVLLKNRLKRGGHLEKPFCPTSWED